MEKEAEQRQERMITENSTAPMKVEKEKEWRKSQFVRENVQGS